MINYCYPIESALGGKNWGKIGEQPILTDLSLGHAPPLPKIIKIRS